MTICVAAKLNAEVILVADRLTNFDNMRVCDTSVNDKMIEFPQFAIAMAGNGPIKHILEKVRADKTWTKFHLDDILKVMEFQTAVCDAFEEFSSAEDVEAMALLIITREGRIFSLHGYDQSFESERFWAVGCGTEYALGFLKGKEIEGSKIDEAAVIHSVDSACHYSIFCAPPYSMVKYPVDYAKQTPKIPAKPRRRGIKSSD